MDGVEENTLYLVNEEFKKYVFDFWGKNRNNVGIEKKLFRLVNRLRIWEEREDWLREALERCKEYDEEG